VACRRCPDQLHVEVTFGVSPQRYTLSLYLREALAFLRSGSGTAYSFADSLPAVLALLREALPEDAPTQAWRRPAGKLAPLAPDSAWAREDDVLVSTLPEVMTRVEPRYPEVATSMGLGGEVLVDALVATDGTVARTRLARSLTHLNEAALEAVRQWTFKPAACAGRPIQVWVRIPVRFTPAQR
jgi:protein TonB